MYLDHFGLNEPPFRITPHTDFFFAGANRGATLDALLYAITHDEGIVKVSGEVGSGKTMLCRVLMERLPANVETIYLANPSLSRDEILFEIADELKLDQGGERPSRLLRALQEHLIGLYSAGRRVVVLIDEAHAMPMETLEEIRLLSNLEGNRHKLLQIVLFGQPELDEHLDSERMRQLKERITHAFRLEPLVHRDVESYIDFRMRAAGYRGPNVFSPGALRLIARASEGLTRRINILADKALLAAFADNTHAITEKEARRAIRDSEFHRFRPQPRALLLAGAGVAAGVAIGFGLHSLITERPVAPVAAIPAAPPPGSLPATPAAEIKSPPTASAETSAEAKAAPTVTAAPSEAIQAAAPANAKIETPSSTKANQPASSQPVPSEPGTSVSAAVPPPRGQLMKQRYAAAQVWLARDSRGRHSIQLMTASIRELQRMEEFLRQATKLVPLEELYVYSVQIDGVQHYRIAYGDFASVSETLAAIPKLPPALRAHNPYQRSIERMRSQNKQ